MKLRAMIKVWCEDQNRLCWIDYNVDGWSTETMISRLKQGVDDGVWIAWRLITIVQQSSN